MDDPAVCGIVALARTPSAVRGENRSLFDIFSLATFPMLLSIDVTYTAVDTWLGSQNYANLMLRFIVYGTVLWASPSWPPWLSPRWHLS